jgi:predicted permease
MDGSLAGWAIFFVAIVIGSIVWAVITRWRQDREQDDFDGSGPDIDDVI